MTLASHKSFKSLRSKSDLDNLLFNNKNNLREKKDRAITYCPRIYGLHTLKSV